MIFEDKDTDLWFLKFGKPSATNVFVNFSANVMKSVPITVNQFQLNQ